ncbi:MAG: hypothetical protein IJ087_06325 [Eggerthellaceae bacterium]|nr:hypothetical protein [Eggerthellaceae bacterium]
MTTNTDWRKLYEEHEIAYLRGDLATSSPESYTLDEMREISAGMDASTAEVEAAMRADFNSMSPAMQARMMDLLGKADPENIDWWRRLLLANEAAA